jgi:hypothetical protein
VDILFVIIDDAHLSNHGGLFYCFWLLAILSLFIVPFLALLSLSSSLFRSSLSLFFFLLSRFCTTLSSSLTRSRSLTRSSFSLSRISLSLFRSCSCSAISFLVLSFVVLSFVVLSFVLLSLFLVLLSRLYTALSSLSLTRLIDVVEVFVVVREAL